MSQITPGTATNAASISVGSVTQGNPPWTENITQIGGSAISLGQALAAASIPVVLTAAQLSTLTPPAAITGYATSAKQDTGNTSLASIDGKITAVNTGAVVVASGSITANAGTNLNTSTLLTTAAHDAAFGTAGSADAQVRSIQGIASMTPVAISAASASIASGAIASGAVASGAFASGSISSGAVASGAFASGSIASGAIATGAIAAGDASIATTEDTASAGGEHLVKVGLSRLDTPVANAGVSNDGDYTGFISDNFRKLWVSGTVPEDTAHVAGEALTVEGSRRIDTLATSAGSSGDWATKNQTAEGAEWSTLAGTATPNGLLVANFTSGDTYTALTSTAQAIKASAGNMYGYYMYNPNTVASYVMIYNIAAASVTVGTSTATLVFCIPPSSGANLMFPVPISFSNAGWSIAAATTGGGSSAPSTALEVMIFYL